MTRRARPEYILPAPDADGHITFSHPGFSVSHDEFGFWVTGEMSWYPLDVLKDCMVNLATKGGTVYDQVMVTEVLRDGCLRVEGGQIGSPYQTEAPRLLERSQDIPCHEIARGYIHTST